MVLTQLRFQIVEDLLRILMQGIKGHMVQCSQRRQNIDSPSFHIFALEGLTGCFQRSTRRTAMNHLPSSAHTAERGLPRSETETRLYGYWLMLVRLLCLTLGVVSVGLFVAIIPSYIAHLHLLCADTAAACNGSGQMTSGDVQRLHEVGLSLDFYVIYKIVFLSIVALGYWLVAAFLFWRKSDDRLALLAAVTLATFPITFTPITFTPGVPTLPWPWWFLARVLIFLGLLFFFLFFYVFPSGHFVPRWTRWIFVVVGIYLAFVYFFPVPSLNPFYRYPVLNDLIIYPVIVGIVIVQIYRYRRVSSPTQRQQTKWVVYGASMGAVGWLVLNIIPLFLPSLFQTGSLASLIALAAGYGLALLIPFTIGFAILRSRLWDIDIIIHRTLLYSILTVLLTGVYEISVFTLQSLTSGLALIRGNQLAIIASTLLIGLLFKPLLDRTRALIDRRFYRRKYDAAKTVAAFSATLRDEVDLNQLCSKLVAVVGETMQPAHISLWLLPHHRYTEEPHQSEKHTTMEERF
jgi:hypothetical protein